MDIQSLSAELDNPSDFRYMRLVNNKFVQEICPMRLFFSAIESNLVYWLISRAHTEFLLLSEYEGRVLTTLSDPGAEGEIPALDSRTMERLAEICEQDGKAVLEMEDTGEIYLVETQRPGEFAVWQVTR